MAQFTSLALLVGFFSVALVSCASPVRSGHESATRRPNVVLVMADDLGLGDIAPTNPDCRIATPDLDRLAAEGLTFLDAHSSSAVCTPTRYGLLTGRYNWRSRLARGVLNGQSEHLIPADRPTLGHLMRDAGYSTAMIGKWHLGWDWTRTEDGAIDFTAPVQNGPDINGFDRYFAHAASLDMPPYVWVDTGRITAVPDREEGVTSDEDRYGWYRKGPVGADFEIERVLPRLFDEATSYVEERGAQDGSEPFFLYLALPAPHTPIVPIEPFAGRSGLNPYADFVQQVDHHMGELLSALDSAGFAEDTIVIFTSDNGCSPQANFPLLREAGHDPSAGFRGHKADLYEGGHRVPLLVKWPGRIAGGRTTTSIACLTDIYATLSDVVGQGREAVGGEDSHSWLPLFEGEPSNSRATLISHSVNGQFAFRRGRWKLLFAHGSGGWSAPREKAAKEQGLPPLQLYDLVEDPAETKNVAADNPELVDELLRDLDSEVRRGRSTSGAEVSNDREVVFLPDGVASRSR
ncbi:MAG: arylsulfatase [Planctomycetota bacterium]